MSEPTSTATPTFDKLPPTPAQVEDANHDGLVDQPDMSGWRRYVPRISIRWLLWISDAGTEFCNGFLDGLLPGTGGAGIGAAINETGVATDIATNAAVGFLAGAALNGLKQFHGWRTQNPMPNPFRP